MKESNLMACKDYIENTINSNASFKAAIKTQHNLSCMLLENLLDDIERKINKEFTLEDFKNGLQMLDKVNNIKEDHKIVLVNFFVTKNFTYDIVIDREDKAGFYKVKLARMSTVDFLSSDNVFKYDNWDAFIYNFFYEDSINRIEDLKDEEAIEYTYEWILDKINWLMDHLVFTTIWSEL